MAVRSTPSCRPNSIGLDLHRSPMRAIADAGEEIARAVAKAVPIEHPDEPDLAFLYGTILTDGGDGADGKPSRNVCIFAGRQIDRSPTGSGVSARMALQAARRQAKARRGAAVRELHRRRLQRPGVARCAARRPAQGGRGRGGRPRAFHRREPLSLRRRRSPARGFLVVIGARHSSARIRHVDHFCTGRFAKRLGVVRALQRLVEIGDADRPRPRRRPTGAAGRAGKACRALRCWRDARSGSRRRPATSRASTARRARRWRWPPRSPPLTRTDSMPPKPPFICFLATAWPANEGRPG